MKTKIKELLVGQHVKFVNESRVMLDALVTAIHGEPQAIKLLPHHVGYSEEKGEQVSYPCINLVFVVPNSNQQDQYGRQKESSASVQHLTAGYPATGNFWCFADETEEAKALVAEGTSNTKS